VVLESGLVCCVSRYGLLCYVSPEAVVQWLYYLYGYGYGSPAVGLAGAIYVPDRGAAKGSGFTALRAGVALGRTPWPKFRGNARNTANVQDVTP
jgi:hypothetical protein